MRWIRVTRRDASISSSNRRMICVWRWPARLHDTKEYLFFVFFLRARLGKAERISSRPLFCFLCFLFRFLLLIARILVSFHSTGVLIGGKGGDVK